MKALIFARMFHEQRITGPILEKDVIWAYETLKEVAVNVTSFFKVTAVVWILIGRAVLSYTLQLISHPDPDPVHTPLSKTELERRLRAPQTGATLESLRVRFHASNIANGKDDISTADFLNAYIPDPDEYNEKWKDAGYTYDIKDPIPHNIAALVIGIVFRCQMQARTKFNIKSFWIQVGPNVNVHCITH